MDCMKFCTFPHSDFILFILGSYDGSLIYYRKKTV